MDSSYLSQQVSSIVGQLHVLFDEIGVSNHDREAREAELFAALSETLQKQIESVLEEKKALVDEARKIISAIIQMESALDDSKPRRDLRADNDDLRVTFPLTRCLQSLREKHQQIGKLHRERFEQVKKLVQALESYSSHLEPSFVRITLPPTGPHQSIPPSFDLSPSYVDKLDDEFTRVYEEYTRRVETVKALCENMIQLWAELGTPQAQTDGSIVKYYRDAPEQLGLHEEDIAQLRARRDKLADEKKSREKRLRDLKTAVEGLWEKLGVEEQQRKQFLNANRGCGVRQMNELEDELGRLTELKRQNLHVFVEDARFRLQELWDALYLSEDEMLEFTPAFSDVYSDALLEAHEREMARLEALREQRAPTLALVDRHKTLVRDRDELAASSQDASRLMMRGQKGERRDPGKLLREEKMRKRIAKELPKVTAELCKALEKWEDEWGRPFLVHGHRYLDVIEAADSKAVPGPRSKTPAGHAPTGVVTSSKPPQAGPQLKSAAPPTRTQSVAATSKGAKTPTVSRSRENLSDMGNTNRRGPAPIHHAQTGTSAKGSPSRIPARVPLSNLKHGNNSPERPRPESRAEGGNPFRLPPPPMRAPPPKMRKIVPGSELQLEVETPASVYLCENQGSSVNVRHVEPEDVYDGRGHHESHYSSHSYRLYEPVPPGTRPSSGQHPAQVQGSWHNDRLAQSTFSQAHSVRQISNTSTNVSGSENWETYDDNSEPEPDASDTYYAKMRAARGKRPTPEAGHVHPPQCQAKRLRGIPPIASHASHVTVDNEGNRIISGSEWTDEDAF